LQSYITFKDIPVKDGKKKWCSHFLATTTKCHDFRWQQPLSVYSCLHTLWRGVTAKMG